MCPADHLLPSCCLDSVQAQRFSVLSHLSDRHIITIHPRPGYLPLPTQHFAPNSHGKHRRWPTRQRCAVTCQLDDSQLEIVKTFQITKAHETILTCTKATYSAQAPATSTLLGIKKTLSRRTHRCQHTSPSSLSGSVESHGHPLSSAQIL